MPAAPKRGLAEAEQHVLGQTPTKAPVAPKATPEAKSPPVTEATADATGMTTLPAVTPSSPDVPAPVVTEAPPAKAVGRAGIAIQAAACRP